MKTRLFLLFAVILFQVSFAKTKGTEFFGKSEKIVVTDPIAITLPNLSVCDNNMDGFSVFDLTDQTPIILAAQSGSPSDYVVTYHETLTDANAYANPLTSPYFNITSSIQTIYYRVINVNTNVYAVGTFQLLVNTSPIAVSLSSIQVCDQDANTQNGSTSVDLTVQTPSILALQTLASPNYTVTYYVSQADAQAGVPPILSPTAYACTNGQTIWYRVEQNSTGCYNVGSFQIMVNAPLALTTPTPLAVCDSDASPNDQYTSFDLTVKDAQIAQGTAGYTVTYYPSFPITTSSVAIVNPTAYVNVVLAVQTLGVKVISPQGCVSYTTLDIRVLPIPMPNNNPPSLSACDGNGDGLEVFDLTVNAAYIINGDPNVVLHYYDTMSDALNSTNEILTPTAALVGFGVWIKVVNFQIDFQGNYCFTIVQQPIQVTNSLSPYIFSQGNVNSICVDYVTNAVISNLTLQTNIVNPVAYTFQWYENGVPIVGSNSPTYTVNTPSPSGANRIYNVAVTSTSYPSCNGFSNAYTVLQSGPAAVPSGTSGYTIANLSGIQSIIVDVVGYGTYEYSLDDGPHQTSNVFDNVSIGIHMINVWDTEGNCYVLMIEGVQIVESLIPAPTGLNSQSFNSAATLASIVVSGANVQWYASATSTTPLPLGTQLVNGTTYYATQTVNGTQSAARLAVTVTLSLGIADNEVLPIYYSPNPVKNSLTLQSNTILKSVLVYTMLGQKVFEQSYNAMLLSIDLSSLNAGNYIVKVEGETGQKILRIIKE